MDQKEFTPVLLMKASIFAFICLVSPILLIPVHSSAATPSSWHDDLVDHMTGYWRMEGQIMGRDAHHAVQAEWVLNGQFLRIHEKTAAGAPASEHEYEAIWFLGYDQSSDRYVLHLLDIFGGRFSETLGYGVRDGDSIRFIYEYPDGPFHTTFLWASKTGTWLWLMEQKDKDGKWTQFANLKLMRVSR
jgi:hypothetical protein